MAKHIEPDKILMKMPSLSAVKSFVAAAKYQSFTTAAESLCVTQAAISRQIRKLESALGVKLFNRIGRTVELTEAGSIFYDATYLSFVNIAQAAQKIAQQDSFWQELTICCSPAFSAFWLSAHLADFYRLNPDINVKVITTNSFLNLEPGLHPDVFISKISVPREGYTSIPLLYDLIYPVCSPELLRKNPDIASLENLKNASLLNLSPYGRAQLAEHIDWNVWFAELGTEPPLDKGYLMTSNDYNLLIQSALNQQGICLGWHHLVHPMIEKGQLVKVGESSVTFREKYHYLIYNQAKLSNAEFKIFKDWLLAYLSKEETSVLEY